eukprot:TRINITY_DN19241_c0_g1_i5.p1 TRINITY_DN19241_c0_g1~~TRINITY_DN19241_c0_g1_i5.p1  ORF type:complete len:974 (+),score=151.85 TRINITY_DN19241_c0_g1_i5:909-3830(+)
MTVLLVHKPPTPGEERDHSSAALSVSRGTLNDPQEFPGMAHFCEHMLFLGNNKYPTEGDYRKYLQEHGGSSNATTSPEMTLYKFQITDEYFPGGLDRFLNFFKSPLFTESATNREILAVDSEFKRNTLSDSRRCYNLMKYLSDPSHPFHRFGDGNLKSLEEIPSQNNLNIRKGLLDFYEDNYSADIMSLVLVSNRSLDALEEMVVCKESFGDVKAKGFQKNVSHSAVHFGSSQLGRFAEYLPIQDQPTLNVVVPLPQVALSDGVDFSYTTLIVDLFGHEGPGSLCQTLRERGLITDLYAGDNIKRLFGHINIELVLTSTGKENLLTIVAALCDYAKLIGSEVEGLCKQFHAEKVYSKQLYFDFLPNTNATRLATTLATNLRYAANPENCIRYNITNCPPTFTDAQKTAIQECTSAFHPNNMLILLANNSLSSEADNLQTEPWLGVNFRVRDLTASEKDQITSGSDYKMELPGKNEWLPRHTDIIEKSNSGSSSARPELIKSSDSVGVWWVENEKFNTPKCRIMAALCCGVFGNSAKGSVVANWLLPDLCSLALAAKYYSAEDSNVTKFSISADRDHCSLVVTASGYSDCTTRLCVSVVNDILTFTFTEDHFNIIKENRLREISNSKLRNTMILATETMRELMNTSYYTTADVDAAMKEITYKEFVEILSEARRTMAVEMFAYGNVTAADAQMLGKEISKLVLVTNPGSTVVAKPPRNVVRLPEKALTEHLYIQHEPNPVNKESTVSVRYQFDTFSYSLAARMLVLRTIMSPRFFTTLRTQEQLGYSVNITYLTLNEVLNLQLNVRSSTNPSVVHQRIDVFLKNFYEELRTMPESDITDCIKSTKMSYAAPNPNMETEFSCKAHEVLRGVYRWDRENKMLLEFDTITPNEIISLFETFVRPSSWVGSSRRSVVSVYCLNDVHAALIDELSAPTRVIAEEDESEHTVDISLISDISTWRSDMQHFVFDEIANVGQ